MEESKAQKAKEDKTRLELEKFYQQKKLTSVQIAAFNDLFSVIDLNGGGTVDDEEFKIGLEALGLSIPQDEYTFIKKQVNPNNDDFDIVKFIHFITFTKKFKQHAYINTILYQQRLKETIRRRNRYPHIMAWKFFKRYFGWIWRNQKEIERQAALIILSNYRAKKELDRIRKKEKEERRDVSIDLKERKKTTLLAD
jgi:hypothetical protein